MAGRRTRRARLRFLTDSEIVSYERRILARIAERLDDLEQAVHELRAALDLQPDEPIVLDGLDRLLGASFDRHQDRMALWVGVANRRENGKKRAGGICARCKHLRA